MTATDTTALAFPFTMTQRDRYRVQRALSRRSRGARIYQWSCVLLAALTQVIAILRASRHHASIALAIAEWAPYTVFLMLWGFALIPFSQWIAARRHMKVPAIRGEWTFEIRSEGLTARGPMTTTTVSWDAIERVVETPEFLLFYYAKNCAYFLPTHAIATEADMHAVRLIVSAHMPDRVQWREEPAAEASVC